MLLSRFCLVIVGFPLFSVFGLIFNIMVVNIYRRRPEIRRKLPNILLLNQVFIDLFNCGVFCPVYTVNAVHYYLGVRNKRVYVRIISNTLQQFSSISSILNLLPLALDRCFAMSHPLLHRRVVTRKVVLCSTAIVWFTSLCLACVYGYIVDQNYINGNAKEHLDNFYFAFTCLYHVVFALLIIINSCTFYKSQVAMRDHNNFTSDSGGSQQDRIRQREQEREQRLVRIFLLIFLVFFIAFSPALVFNMLLSFANFKYSQHLAVDAVAVIAMALSSAINPLIIMVLNKDFKIKWLCLRNEQEDEAGEMTSENIESTCNFAENENQTMN